MKYSLAFLAAAAVCVAIAAAVYTTVHNDAPMTPLPQEEKSLMTIRVKGVPVQVTVADTPEKRRQGLSGRTGLAEGEGMLFAFEKDGDYAFWMKDMLFSIDILWLGASGTVVHIVPNASPESYPEHFSSPKPARFVLELPAGWTKVHDMKIGDKIEGI